jgi:Lipid A 3-O-deacylase (PagL)
VRGFFVFALPGTHFHRAFSPLRPDRSATYCIEVAVKDIARKVIDWVGRIVGNSPKMKLTIGAFVLLLLLALATRCHAQEISAAVGSTIVRGSTPVITLQYEAPLVNDTNYWLGITLIGSSTFANQFQQNNFAWHAGIMDGFGKFDIGLGIAYLQNTDVYNGSNTNFTLRVGYQLTKRISIGVQHFSNAGSRKPNKGRDMLMISAAL